jgi:hypothetical protein
MFLYKKLFYRIYIIFLKKSGGNAGPRWNGPMGPVPPNPPNMIYRGPPPNQGFNMMQTRAPIPMQDPGNFLTSYFE